MKTKKFLALLLAIVLCLSMLPATALATGETATISLSVDKTEVKPDDTLTVTVSLDKTTVTASFDFYVEYEKAYYDYVESVSALTSGNDSFKITDSNESGTCHIAFSSNSEGNGTTIQSGTVATITFKAKSSVTSTTETKFEIKSEEFEWLDDDENAIAEADTTVASVTIDPESDSTVVFTVYEQTGANGTPTVVKEYSEAELKKLAGTNELKYNMNGKSDVITSSHVEIALLLEGKFAAGDKLQFTCSDGIYTKSIPTYEQVTGTGYYYAGGETTAAGEEVSAVLALDQSGYRFLRGSNSEEGILAGKNFPSGVTAITVVHPVAFTVYEQTGANGTPTVVKEYSEAELKKLAGTNELKYNMNGKSDVITSSHVEIALLLEGKFAAGDKLQFTCSDGIYTKSIPTYEQVTGTGYYYAGGETTAAGEEVSAVLALDQSGYRFLRGSNSEEGILAGKNFPSGVTAITVVHPCTEHDYDENGICKNCGDVKPVYVVTADEDKAVVVGETVNIDIAVSNKNADETEYNAYYLKITYDNAALTYNEIEVGNAESKVAVDTATSGMLIIKGYGAKLECASNKITLSFTANTVGTSNVEITEAKIDKASNAAVQDAPDAVIADSTTAVEVGNYMVTLSDDLDGSATTVQDYDYTFSVKDIHYDYTITYMVEGREDSLTPTDNGDGTYTIPAANINGNIAVASEKTAKTYSVKISESGSQSAESLTSATYKEPYSFTVTAQEGYTKNISMTIGGQEYSGFTQNEDGSYTIPGEDITGEIAITVTKTWNGTLTVIKFTGIEAGEIEGDLTRAVTSNQDYTFILIPVEGYSYKVSAKAGEAKITLTKDGNSYTIPASSVTGAEITVTVAKEQVTRTVTVNEYVKLEGAKSVWLITVTDQVAEGKTLKYGDDTMYITTKGTYKGELEKAYIWLVISEKSAEDILAEAKAEGKITEAEATSTQLADDYDVNGTARVDVNDAQLVYNMYNAVYGDFTTVNVGKFLAADVNGDKTVNVNDAAAIIAQIK